MAAPVLQKTWQGGTTLGGTDLVNVVIDEASSELTARTAMLAIKQALTTFNLNPWTVVGSSDSLAASMDTTDRWTTVGDLVFRTTGGTAFSWIVLQQSNIAANCQILLGLEDTLASDPNRQHLTIQAVVGSGFTGGSITALPTAAGAISINALTSPWLGSMTTGTKIVISCLGSSDGECTRIVVSNDSTGIPFTCLGFEKPRLPNANWVSPACFYLLSETIVSGLSCFRWEAMQDGTPFLGIVKDHVNADLQVAMRMMGPMISTTEAVDWIADGISNPAVWAGTLIYDGKDADFDWGTLFDWYWVNRNVGGAHMLDTDSAPAAGDRTFVCVGDCVWGWLDDSATDLSYVAPPQSMFFGDDTANPTSEASIANASQTGLGPIVDLTMSCWVYIKSGTGQITLIDKFTAPGGYRMYLNTSRTTLNFNATPTSFNTWTDTWATGGVALDQWNHFAVTRDQVTGENRGFKNGVQIGATAVRFPGENLLATATAFRLGGANNFNTDLHGYMAEAQLWSVAQAPAWLGANYNVAHVGNEANLEGYWPGSTDFNDLTANTNHLTPVAGGSVPAPAISPTVGRPF